jgi:hypothetical protein
MENILSGCDTRLSGLRKLKSLVHGLEIRYSTSKEATRSDGLFT